MCLVSSEVDFVGVHPEVYSPPALSMFSLSDAFGFVQSQLSGIQSEVYSLPPLSVYSLSDGFGFVQSQLRYDTTSGIFTT